MARTLVKSDTKGWYVDVTNPEKKIRAKPDDNIFDDLLDAQAAQAVLDQAGISGGNGDEAAASEEKPKAAGKKADKKAAKAKSGDKQGTEKPEPQSTVAETGKILVGKTLTIQCAWKLSGNKRCPNTRTIKPQDRFQVKYCVEHQAEHRKEMRRAKQKERTKARQEAKAAETKKSGTKATTKKSGAKAKAAA